MTTNKTFKLGDRVVVDGELHGLVRDFLPASGRYLIRLDHKHFEGSQDNGMRDYEASRMEPEKKL